MTANSKSPPDLKNRKSNSLFPAKANCNGRFGNRNPGTLVVFPVRRKYRMLTVFLALLCVLISQHNGPLDLNSILARADSVNTAVMDSAKCYSYEFSEKIIFEELGDNETIKKADTSISRVIVKNGKEISRTIIYPPGKSEDKKSEKEMSAGASIDLSPDNPDYNFELIDSSGAAYAIKISPKKNPPEKEQIDGIFYIDKNTFLATRMDFAIPRPKDVKQLKMSLNFTRLQEGPFVIADMKVQGLAAPLWGLIKIRFKVTGEFYDYVVLNDDA